MSIKILVIEDNDENLYLVTYILENNGYEVVQARNGREGLEKAQENPPDMILLDIQLPVMDGYSVAEELVTIPALKGVPIVALTAYAMPGDRKRALEAGCSGYIGKPIDPHTFLNKVEEYL